MSSQRMVSWPTTMGSSSVKWSAHNVTKSLMVCLHVVNVDIYFPSQSIKDHMGEEKITQFNNFCLRYLADLELPKKRYTTLH